MLTEVFDRYKHLDHLLSNIRWLPDSFEGHVLNDLWLAVRAAQTGAQVGDRPATPPVSPSCSCAAAKAVEGRVNT